MVLYIVGLGLGDERDITLRGLDAVKSCSRVYLEMYTSILPGVDKSRQEELYGKELIIADRQMVEQVRAPSNRAPSRSHCLCPRRTSNPGALSGSLATPVSGGLCFWTVTALGH